MFWAVIAVIIVLKEESRKCRKSLVEPVFEEFLPLKKSSGDDDLDRHYKVETNKEDTKEKINWVSSLQLWNGDSGCSHSDRSNNKHSLEYDLRMVKNLANLLKLVFNFCFICLCILMNCYLFG